MAGPRKLMVDTSLSSPVSGYVTGTIAKAYNVLVIRPLSSAC